MNLNGSLGLAVFIPVGFRYFPDYTAGIAGGYDIGRNIFGYDASSGDYRVIANGHPGKDTGLRTDPYVIADSHGKSVFQTFITLLYVKRVAGGIDAYVRGDECVIADTNFRSIQDNEIHVGEEIIPNLDIIAIIALERG